MTNEQALSQEPCEDDRNNLCSSCTNIGCEFQSGIVRTKCAFYMPPHIETDNCGNYVVMQPTVEVLEQIRAEIEQKQYDFMSDGDYNEGIRFGLMLAYQIIDKYNTESEVRNENNDNTLDALGDAISRDMALEKMADYVASGYADSAEDFEEYSRIICQLPSVTQKPIECEDAISRDAVFNAIEHEDKWLLAAKGHNGLTEIAFSGLKARVDALPHVTQKSGKWLAYEVQLPDRTILNYRCSVCGRKLIGYNTETLSEAPFCHCGAKMESEDK